MAKPIIRHSKQIIYDDTTTHIGAPLGFGDTNINQTALEYVDSRLDALEGVDALPLTGITLTQSPVGVPGRMSDGTGGLPDNPSHFDVLVPEDSFANLMETLVFTLTIPGADDVGAANSGHLGTVYAILNGVVQTDSFDLAAVFVPALADAAQIYPPASSVGATITITSVQKFGASSVHQIFKGRINLNGAFDAPGIIAGENTIALIHNFGAVTQTSAIVTFFYDNAGSHPAADIPTIVQNAIASAKYISGVQKYFTGDIFDISTVVGAVFDNTFHNDPLVLTMDPVAITNVEIAYNNVLVVGPNSPPRVGDLFSYVAPYTIDMGDVLNENARITIYGRDPFSDGVPAQSISENRMVNTYGVEATATDEPFIDENRRLSHFTVQGNNASPVDQFDAIPGAITGVWTSATILDDGEALLFNNALTFPTQNFPVGYLPAQVGNDYSAFAASQYYIRAIYENGVPHSSGKIELLGWLLATFDTTGAPTAKIEIKLPTQTGWLDLGTPYNAFAFTGVDGDGCRTDQNDVTHRYDWTSGVFSTAFSGDMYIIRITLLNAAVPALTNLQETGW